MYKNRLSSELSDNTPVTHRVFVLFFIRKGQIALTCRVIAFKCSPVGRRPNVANSDFS